jgi:hypothetical protein
VTAFSDRHQESPRSALHLDDSAYLAVLSTPIRTRWKGPPASRNLERDSVDLMTMTCQPVATGKIKLQLLDLSRADTGGGPSRAFRSQARKCSGLRAVGRTFPTTDAQMLRSQAVGRTFPSTDAQTRGLL